MNVIFWQSVYILNAGFTHCVTRHRWLKQQVTCFRLIVRLFMYTLYASKNTYSMSAHLLLEELQVDYQITWFDIKNVDEHPGTLKTINPNLKVPVIITTDGPIYESAAILVYLAEKHGSQFMPGINNSRRGQLWQWQFYLMSTLQPEVLNQFHPERYLPGDLENQQTLLASSRLKLEQIWQTIENGLDGRQHNFCGQYSICDMLFAMQALWTESRPDNLQRYPNILENLNAIYSRTAAKTVLREHNVENLAMLIHHQCTQSRRHREIMR